MKNIRPETIRDAVAGLCVKANTVLRKDIQKALQQACIKERGRQAKDILCAISKNAVIAKRENLAICQDTGMPCVFVEIGNEVNIRGDLRKAINQGVERGYKRGYFRDSIVLDPLARGRSGFTPAVIHFDFVKGNNLRLTVFPKGFGCENKTQLEMFRPTAELADIREFIVSAVKNAGADACPPYVVGVGIGGTADYACFLAKKALLRGATSKPVKLERDLLKEINALNIGPMGLGGKTTALSVNIETYPTHIAGLPVAVNICCHALRSATARL